MRRDGSKLAVEEEDGEDGLGLGKGMVESIVVESWSAEYGAKMQTFVRDKQEEYQDARQRRSKAATTCRQGPAQK